MYLITCLREIIMGIIRQLFKRRMREDSNLSEVVKYEREKFTNGQRAIIDRTLKIGLTESQVDKLRKIIKPKYSEKQMILLCYGVMLDIDVSKFSSYCLSPTEMEYNLYLSCIDRYLGKNYLSNLLEKTKLTIADRAIRDKLAMELTMKFKEHFEEISATKVNLIEDKQEESDEVRLAMYESLKSKCINRDINPSTLEVASIEDMKSRFLEICKNKIKEIEEDAIPLNLKGTGKEIYPPVNKIDYVLDNMNGLDTTVNIVEKGDIVATFYPLRLKGQKYIYLVGEGMYPLKILY